MGLSGAVVDGVAHPMSMPGSMPGIAAMAGGAEVACDRVAGSISPTSSSRLASIRPVAVEMNPCILPVPSPARMAAPSTEPAFPSSPFALACRGRGALFTKSGLRLRGPGCVPTIGESLEQRLHAMKVRDIMTSPVFCLQPTQGISDAIQLMLERRISGVPVTTPQGELVGIVTEGDLLRRHELGTVGAHSWLKDLFLSPGSRADEYVHTHGRKIADVMTDQPVTIEPDARLSDAIDMMTVHHVRRLPVLQDGRVIGILARADVLRALMPLAAEPPVATDDNVIREAVEAALERGLGAGVRDLVKVEVYRGAVVLSGAVTDERLVSATRVAAENTPGVTSVTNQLIVVGPFVGASVPAPPL